MNGCRTRGLTCWVVLGLLHSPLAGAEEFAGTFTSFGEKQYHTATLGADGELTFAFDLEPNRALEFALFFGAESGANLTYPVFPHQWTVSGDDPGTLTHPVPGLRAGTYLVALRALGTVYPYSYGISTAETPAAGADDAEPNGTAATALPLPLGVDLPGRLGYRHTFSDYDQRDVYLLDLPWGGALTFTLTHDLTGVGTCSGSSSVLHVYEAGQAAPLVSFDSPVSGQAYPAAGPLDLPAGEYVVELFEHCWAYGGYTLRVADEILWGDVDGDGVVDAADVAEVAADLGRADCDGACTGDVDLDGDVDGLDLLAVAMDYGRAEPL